LARSSQAISDPQCSRPKAKKLTIHCGGKKNEDVILKRVLAPSNPKYKTRTDIRATLATRVWEWCGCPRLVGGARGGSVCQLFLATKFSSLEAGGVFPRNNPESLGGVSCRTDPESDYELVKKEMVFPIAGEKIRGSLKGEREAVILQWGERRLGGTRDKGPPQHPHPSGSRKIRASRLGAKGGKSLIRSKL